jgi:hypothetical protein
MKHNTPLGPVEETNRHFQIICFRDRYDTPCSLKQSSLGDCDPPGSSAVWLDVQKLPARDEAPRSPESATAPQGSDAPEAAS